MLIAATHMYQVSVIDHDSRGHIGVVQSAIFDPDRGVLRAVAVRTSGIIPHIKYLSFNDIVTFENHAVVCDSESLCTIDDLPRVHELLVRKCPILGQTAITKTDHNLGKVVELMIDEASGLITQYHTRSLLDRRILLHTDVQEITPVAVIFKDDQGLVRQESELSEVLPAKNPLPS